MTGRIVGGHALVEPAILPEPGTWYRTDEDVEGVPVWARVPLEVEGHEDDDALHRAWERLRHLDHPAIPRAVHLNEEAGLLLVAAPVGVPLARLIEHRHDAAFTMTPGTVLDVGAQLADALVHAHERGRPHGCLSPDNIWVTAEGRLMIWGFADGPDSPASPRWTAPERARGRRASGDADQWSLGALLAALVTGREPWRSDDPQSDARIGDVTHLSGPVMEQWKPLGRLVERTLSAEPRERFPSAHPVRQAITAMRARVPQASDLPAMGAELVARFGPPPLEAAPPASFHAYEAMELPEDGVGDEGPSTTVSEDPPPLDGLDPLAMVGMTPSVASAGDAPTDVATSPTRVPDSDELIDDDDPDEQADAIETAAHPAMPGGPTLMPEPLLPTGIPSAEMSGEFDMGLTSLPDDGPGLASDGPPSFGDMAVAEREEDDTEPPPAWHEQVPIRRIAPWAVGSLVVVLLLYLVLG